MRIYKLQRENAVHPTYIIANHLKNICSLYPGEKVILCASRDVDTEKLMALLDKLANLNPNAGEIGAGMLASLVDDARKIVG